MKCYIGFDEREEKAVCVAKETLYNVSGIEAEYLRAERLRDAGFLWRLSDRRGGQAYDFISQAPKATSFAISRFLTPLLCQRRWALFTDCDVVFFRSPLEIFSEIEEGKAVYVVKHKPVAAQQQYKMVNQQQTIYPRKNWSSVMLFDCEHPAHRRL